MHFVIPPSDSLVPPPAIVNDVSLTVRNVWCYKGETNNTTHKPDEVLMTPACLPLLSQLGKGRVPMAMPPWRQGRVPMPPGGKGACANGPC